MTQGPAHAYRGDAGPARAAADAVVEASTDLGEFNLGVGYSMIAASCLAAGDAAGAWNASEAARRLISWQPMIGSIFMMWSAEAALACGDVTTARSRADEAASVAKGWYLSAALTTCARVKIAQGQVEEAEQDAYEALGIAESIDARLSVPDISIVSPPSHVVPAITARRRGSSARRSPCGVRWVRPGSKSMTLATRPQSQIFVKRWVTTTLRQLGPRVRHCPSTRRSPMCSAVAVNESARRAAGGRSPQPSSTWRGLSAKVWPTEKSVPGSSFHHVRSKRTSPTSTPSWVLVRAFSSRKRQHARVNW